MKNKLEDKLNKRIEEGTYRSLSSFEGIDFWSNDYLGFSRLSTNEILTSFGSTGSRLIAGNSSVSQDCEEFLSHFFQSESALVFNSGYDANLGIFGSIPQKGDVVIYDEKVHASVRDGIRLSFAKSFSFKHNSLDDLEKKLQLPGECKYVAIESLYSMDGDMAPIIPILNVCKKYNAHLVVDEAHAGGIYGTHGKGICEALGIEQEVFVRLITFGKAYGSHGAVVLCNELVKNYLINFARSFIYTTALPTTSFIRIMEIVTHPSLEEQRSKLMENIQYFRNQFADSKFTFLSEINSPIQLVKIGDVSKTNELANYVQDQGFAVKAILSPTVAKGEEGIRICLHSFNSLESIELLSNYLGK